MLNTKTGECIKTLKGHSNTVYCLVELKNGHLASGSWDKTIKLWNIKIFQCFQILEGHSYKINCLIELNNAFLASSSSDNTNKIVE